VWLCEAAFDSYLPLIEALQALEREKIAAPITLGITPCSPISSRTRRSSASSRRTWRGASKALPAPRRTSPRRETRSSCDRDFWHDRLTRLSRCFDR